VRSIYRLLLLFSSSKTVSDIEYVAHQHDYYLVVKGPRDQPISREEY
jgi:hypothetical protein